jgi:NAD(P)-dependent dehydrogenase (short-subunit alcohol dehydrogenase family)
MVGLEGMVAIVTGAASGIGAACAARLAREGARVVIADLSAGGAQAQAAQLRGDGGEASACVADIGDEASATAMVDFALKKYGGLDILVNNAADTKLSSTRDVAVESTDVAVWDEIFRVNLRGTMLCCKHAIPRLRARGGGSIVNMCSGAGLTGALSHSAYGASKAGVAVLTQYVATQHGKEAIRCNAIAPGLIVTPATAQTYASGGIGDMMLAHHLTARLGTPQDIAAIVAFLASAESAFITGQIISVDGGLLAHAPYYADVRRASAGPS